MKHFLIGMAMLAASASLAAQSMVTGSIRRADGPVTVPREGRMTGDEGREIGDRFAACVVNRHYAGVQKALALTYDSAAQYSALHKMLDNECWNTGGGARESYGTDVEMTTGPVQFRTSLYRAFVRRAYSRTPLAITAAPLTTSGGHSIMVALADCVIRQDNAGSLRMIMAPAGSTAEIMALRGLAPQLGQCLPPGRTVAVTKSAFSAALAEAYYREATASARGRNQ